MKFIAVLGFILSICGGLLVAFIGLTWVVFDGYFEGYRDSSIWLKALLLWGLAIAGWVGGSFIFKKPAKAMEILLWVWLLLLVLEPGSENLDFVWIALTTMPFMFAALLARIYSQKALKRNPEATITEI